MIVYEVNLKISSSVFSEYEIWLDSHIEKMMKFEGFCKFKVYKIQSKNNKQRLISIHYYIKNISCLNEYLDENSKKMRLEGIEKFYNKVLITRRILLEK